MPPLRNREYTVGWICTLSVEMAAACAMLDENHGTPTERSPLDNNVYIMGTIGRHNIVIARPDGDMKGTGVAATAAAHLLASFQSIHIGLTVGIGGGVPTEEYDIRLGDVVISKPDKRFGGVVQFDHGDSVGGGFTCRGPLNKPPLVLLNAMEYLQARHEIEDSKMADYLTQMLTGCGKMKPQYAYQGQSNDLLFESDYFHDTDRHGNGSCEHCDPHRLIRRSVRDDTTPCIHYGIVASSDHLPESGIARDLIAKELNAKCFETEAAGLMDIFPCTVIRGICNYADSHQNGLWQRYAAATAAAYAKELLQVVPARVVNPGFATV